MHSFLDLIDKLELNQEEDNVIVDGSGGETTGTYFYCSLKPQLRYSGSYWSVVTLISN